VKDEPIWLDQKFLSELEAKVQQIEWPYQNNVYLLQLRDKAMAALFILTGIRVSEREQLIRKMFHEYANHIAISEIQPLKHGLPRDEIVLPKTGGLAPFTKIFAEWLQNVPEPESVIFPKAKPNGEFIWNQVVGRGRVHQIIKQTTGLFPHWFRGVCETIYGKIIFKKDAWKLKEFMGLVNLDSTTPYVGGSWTENKREIFKVKIT